MPWTRPTLPEIKTRMETDVTSRMTGNIPLLRFSALKIFANAFAGTAHSLHGYLAYLANQLSVITAEGVWLDLWGLSRGVVRNAASYSTGTLNLTGSNGNTIAIGTIYISDTGIEYATTTVGTISGGVAAVNVKAKTAGEIGNLPATSLLNAQLSVAGVNSQGTTGALTGGADQEGDESLRARILNVIQSPAAGGSETDYKRWATGISGVERAWVFGGYYGAGSVAVAITAVGSNPVPSGGLVSSVQAYLDTVRPVTAIVTTVPIVAKTVNITVKLNPNIDSLKAAILTNLQDMFEVEAEPGGMLYLTHLQKAINIGGVVDYQIAALTVASVSQPIANYDFTAFDYMVLGTVTFQSL